MVRQFLRQAVGQDQWRSAAYDRIKHLVEAPPVTIGGAPTLSVGARVNGM
jgi:hypothetical protein